jgi:acetyl-CoA acetyltransferase
MPDFLNWDAARISADRAFEMAGVSHDDLDVAEFYDAFTIVPVMGLEAAGFCAPGEGGAFVSGGRTAPGGTFRPAERRVDASGGATSEDG